MWCKWQLDMKQLSCIRLDGLWARIELPYPCHRYVCPRCLRTFIEEEYHDDWVCWKCGELLTAIGPDAIQK